MDSEAIEKKKLTPPNNKFTVSGVSFEPMIESIYLKPSRMRYTQVGRNRVWDMMFSHNSVACLLYHVDKHALVFVKQFRPAVYTNRVLNEFEKGKLAHEIDWSKYPSDLGVTHELCAGIVDKDKPLVEIMREEILEECGYDCPIDKISKVTSFRCDVGTAGALQTIFLAEIDSSMHISEGGGNVHEEETIDVVYVPLNDGEQFAMDETVLRPPGFMFAVTWFYAHKAAKYRKNIDSCSPDSKKEG